MAIRNKINVKWKLDTGNEVTLVLIPGLNAKCYQDENDEETSALIFSK